MIRRLILLSALLGIAIALFPGVRSFYEITGEENLDGQLIGLLHYANAAVRPQPKLAANTSIKHAEIPPFGMNIFLEWEPSPDVREEAFRQLRGGGFSFARQSFVWEDIEIHARGDFIDRRNDPNGVDAWEKYDHIVGLSNQYGIELLGRIDNPPEWSRAAGNEAGTLGPPDDYNDYGNFVHAVVSRYKDQVTYFQLWNEPNGNEEWGLAGPNPEQFTELLCIGYQRAKDANPDAVIVAPALTPTRDISEQNVNDLIFMQRMYDAGAGDCFDVMAVQGYGLRSGPTDRRLQWNRINFGYHLFMRDMMVANGDAEKAIWISETGWNAIPDGIVPEGAEMFGKVSLEQQARYAVELFERVEREWSWIGAVHYWFLKRPAPEPDQQYYYFRAMEPDFTPLPAWDALAAMPKETVDQAVQQREIGRFRPILFHLSTFLAIIVLIPMLTPDE